MKDPRPTAIWLGALAAVLASACGPRRIAGPSPPGREWLILLPDPDGGALGRATVSSRSGAVDLVGERSATQVSANRPPTPPMTMDDAAVQRIFGDALSTLPPPPRFFTLYFRFESDDLTDDSRGFVPKILRLVAERPVPDVVVVGHTDTTGTATANFELGLKRATTVRNLLVQAGLDASFIEVTSHGKADPLIRTADNTYEPRNRRVEIAVR